MFGVLSQIPNDDRRETLWAVITTFFVLVAHALLETSRDTIFLSHLPASQLPWVYLAVAVLALLTTRYLGRSAGARGDLLQLIILQLAAAAGTFAMFVVTDSERPWTLYALYLWGSLASTLILIRFWLLLSDRFAISQAKKLFPLIAAGPLLGSLVGYGLAGVLCRIMAPADLLAVSAVFFLLSGGASLVLWRAHHAQTEEAAVVSPADDLGVRASIALAVRHVYLRRVALLLLIASVTVTLGDFIFKAVVAREVEAKHLGTFFATSYFAFDLAALVLLLTAVAPLVRSRGVSEALAVQPLLLLGGSILLTATGGVAAVLWLRGVDGALRWSLHKTATELLYVPLSPRLRSAVKAMSDIVAHRGGQALGSLVILGWLALQPSERMMGPVLIVCTLIWIMLAVSLRQPYLNLFRDTLNETAIETRLEFPDLDMASLETLIAALSSPEEHKVRAALDLLERTGRVHLIPALILYHPSSEVVLRALELFTAAHRADVLPLAEQLLRHRETAVRAATMRACALLRPDVEMLQRATEADSPSVAATAVIALASQGIIEPNEATARLEPLLGAEGDEADEVRHCIALALRDHPLPAFAPLLEQLATGDHDPTRRAAAQAIGAAHDERHLPVMVNLLARHELREPIREALLSIGAPALAYLRDALRDLTLPRAVRIHLPRTISRFPAQEAADVLLSHLRVEASGTVRYKILRGLGRLIATHPHLHLAPDIIEEVFERQLRAILEGLHWQVVLQEGGDARPERRTIGHELLVELLQEKETLAMERLFRVLGLLHADEDLARVYAGLQNADAEKRASSRELLDGVLSAKWRKIVAALTEELPNAERLAATREVQEPESLEYDALIVALVSNGSLAVSSVAAYHAAELGLRGLHLPMESHPFDRTEWLGTWRQRSFDMLDAATNMDRRASA